VSLYLGLLDGWRKEGVRHPNRLLFLHEMQLWKAGHGVQIGQPGDGSYAFEALTFTVEKTHRMTVRLGLPGLARRAVAR
jgi:hypothetical protein